MGARLKASRKIRSPPSQKKGRGNFKDYVVNNLKCYKIKSDGNEKKVRTWKAEAMRDSCLLSRKGRRKMKSKGEF